MSEQKRAILVVGLESAGNRMLTRQLVLAGALGDGAHHQRWDDHPPVDETPIVWLYSVPHAGEWPDIAVRVDYLRRRGYRVHVVVIVRDWLPCQRSQVATGHVKTMAQADDHLQRAYLHIFAHLGRAAVPYTVVTLAGLQQRPGQYLRWLRDRLGLAPDASCEAIYDAKRAVEAWLRGYGGML